MLEDWGLVPNTGACREKLETYNRSASNKSEYFWKYNPKPSSISILYKFLNAYAAKDLIKKTKYKVLHFFNIKHTWTLQIPYLSKATSTRWHNKYKRKSMLFFDICTTLKNRYNVSLNSFHKSENCEMYKATSTVTVFGARWIMSNKLKTEVLDINIVAVYSKQLGLPIFKEI